MEHNEKSEKGIKMRRKSMIIITASIITLGTCAIAATKLHSRAAEKQDEAVAADTRLRIGEIKPVNVETETVEAGRLVERVVARGITEAKTDVTFSAEVAGRIQYLGAEPGDRVKRGQILARVDTRSLRAQRDQAAAGYELARTTHGRLKHLGPDLISPQKLDETRSALTRAKAQLAIASDSLTKSVLRSTVSGVVTARLADKDEYVAPGVPILRVVDHGTIVIEAQLPETQVAMVDAGSSVAVSIDALGEEFEGVVDAVLPAADPVSKTFTVRIEVLNPDLAILVGMSAVVSITSRVHEGVVTLPQDIVIESKGVRSVFVNSDGVAQERMVRLGAVQGDRVAILEGLDPGDEVVVLGHRDLTDGQPIRVVR